MDLAVNKDSSSKAEGSKAPSTYATPEGSKPSADYTSLALRSYDKALYLASRAWRFSNVYAGPMWLYLIGFLVAVLGFYWYQLDSNFLQLHVRIQEASLHAATWGTVGGILRGMWYLKDKVRTEDIETHLEFIS